MFLARLKLVDPSTEGADAIRNLLNEIEHPFPIENEPGEMIERVVRANARLLSNSAIIPRKELASSKSLFEFALQLCSENRRGHDKADFHLPCVRFETLGSCNPRPATLQVSSME